jgi:hypothetical protein
MADGPWQDFGALDQQQAQQPVPAAAPPTAPAEGPWQSYAQPPSDQDQGDLAKGIGMLGSSEGRAQLWQGVQKLPADIIKGTLDWFETPGRAMSQGITPEQEIGFGVNTALTTVGGKTIPREVAEVVAPIAKSFDDGIVKPAAESMVVADEQARTAAPSPPGENAPTTNAGPPPIVETLSQARDLGVIGPEKPSLNELPPQQAREAMLPPQPPGTPPLEPHPQQTAWRQRWEATLDKMGVAGDARQVISSVVDANDEFVQARQGNMSTGQVEQLASLTGLDSTKIDVAGTSAKIKTDAELRNTTEAFRIVNDKIKQAAQDLSDKGGVDDDAEAGALTKLELQRDLLLDATTSSKELIALRAEFGRAGNRLQELQKAMAETNGLKGFLKDSQGRSIDDVRERAKMIADTPPDALPKVLQSTRNQPQHWAYWTWQQGLISGVITHTKYLAVNTGQTYLERVLAPSGAAIIGKLRGADISLMTPLRAHVALIKAVPDSLRAAGTAFKSGLRVPLESEMELTKRNVENPERGAPQVPYGQTVGPEWGMWKNVFNENQLAGAAKVLGIPGKSANMIHTFFKVLNERASLTSRAYDAAHADGGSGTAYWDSFNQHLANPTDETLKGAVEDAYSGSFMEKLGEKSEKWASAVRANPILKWMFPFQHIPLNIARSTIRYSPFAFAGPEMRAALMGEHGAPAQNLAISKMVVGSSIMGYFVDRALSGDVNGDYPTDEKTRREWQLMGTQPNTMRIGEEWHSLERLGPPGNLARLGANLGTILKNYNGQDDDAVSKAVYQSAMAGVNLIGDEVGFQTLRNLIDAWEDPKHATRFAANEVSSLLPYSSFISQNASIMDPDMRLANSLVDGLRYRIPEIRENLLPKRDPLYGEPVPNPGYGSVFRETPVQTDPVKLELDRLGKQTGYFPGAPENRVGGIKLNPEQFDRYEATAGPLVKQMLTAAMNTPRYQSLPPSAQVAMVKGLISGGRARARQAMQMAYPELIQQGIDARTMQVTGAR